ncbi:hypothetical protein [Herpetosiphon giganteus]|nr:hypothetical protein [Herpetosiphon giganteus]MBM7844315.1 hypothetical protein [Herpetosiphon giganteus]
MKTVAKFVAAIAFALIIIFGANAAPTSANGTNGSPVYTPSGNLNAI